MCHDAATSHAPLQDNLNAIKEYDNDSTITLRRNSVVNNEKFEFNPTNPNGVWNEIRQLDNSKKTSGCLSVDILKLISALCQVKITEYFSMMLFTSQFPDPRKTFDVSSLCESSECTYRVSQKNCSTFD